MPYTLETTYRFWDDKTGEYLEVSPMGELPGLLSIAFKSADGAFNPMGFSVTREQAEGLIAMLQKALVDLSIAEGPTPDLAPDREERCAYCAAETDIMGHCTALVSGRCS